MPFGPPPLLSVFSPEVRISSNKADTDIDKIMEMLMTNRIAHTQFDPILGNRSTREYIKGLVFQNSELAPYSKYVNSPEMANMILQSLNAPPVIESLSSSHGSTQTLQEPVNAGREARKSRSLLPIHMGANKKDFYRAKWLAEELGKPPYYGSPSGGHRKDKSPEPKGLDDTDDPEIVQQLRIATEKLKE